MDNANQNPLLVIEITNTLNQISQIKIIDSHNKNTLKTNHDSRIQTDQNFNIPNTNPQIPKHNLTLSRAQSINTFNVTLSLKQRQTLYFTSKKPTCVFLTPFSENKGGGKKGKGRRGEEREGKINKRNFPFKCLACKEERERKIAYWQVPLSIFSPFPLNLGGKSLGGK